MSPMSLKLFLQILINYQCSPNHQTNVCYVLQGSAPVVAMIEPTQQPEEVETVPEQEGPETVAEPTEDSSQVNTFPHLKMKHKKHIYNEWDCHQHEKV